MTEAEWLKCGEPTRMLEFLRGKATNRKFHLFILNCYRRYWFFRFNESAQRAAEILERHADNAVTPSELRKSRRGPKMDWMRFKDMSRAGIVVAESVANHPLQDGEYAAERKTQAMLVRDIFGNPFRPAARDPAWLQWNGGTIPTLAEAIYQERELPGGHLDPVRLALLADMLEDAGCTDLQILEHCRGAGPHVRGCWVLDLVLDKV